MLISLIREKLKSKNVVYGIWSIIPSPILTEVISIAGLDFQIFDLEHGVYDFSSIDSAIRSCESAGCAPFVRIGGLDRFATQKVLDFGAQGLIFPQIKNLEDAKSVVDITNYAPIGTRGFNPFTRIQDYSLKANKEANRNVNGYSLNGVIIENISAANDLEKILEIDEIELIYLGAYDMSVALGKPGDMENPELIKFIETSIAMINKKNKIAGVMALNEKQAKRYVSLGAKFIVIGVDTNLIGQSFSNIITNFTK